MEQAQNALPKSSIVQVTGGSAEQVMSQKAVTDALVNAVSIDMLYPVGIVVWFAQNKNPNVLFPKTQWQYIGENKTVRLATANGLDVLTAGGSDSITLTTPQIPAHNHSFSGSTSSFDYGSKTTNYAGEHFHDSGWGDQDASRYGYYDGTNSNYGSGRSDWDNRKFNTSTDGSHTHSIYIGAHTHTVSGNTENTGSGSPVSIVNMYIKLMGWYRTA
ncbi:conserved hypothetical protein [Xenorhabdus nematophila ATCC 19061]|uniref:Baseplate structural protein Gp10 C-terminal domain-containing protein n=1 Tax=Xenorhabdus nematophila (strain ATCC 19061 / DSM 3370 / CCUG 14189 / LMG 1036 / NCIMB 9965 / AN6) TaxID=406817 RepID=D3V9N4_XENNA|nr:tail fiber protein [Xenorhabdus nematophila]CBJ89272.1 conserved hypothetical protein [Xenorhabdus nematophila ATCC 19061]CEK22174.1 conserved hypothetical protein [Xenorhabdus nematophila AN6/1]